MGLLGDDSFEGIDVAFFSAGGGLSKRFAPAVVGAGATMVDNSSAFRMTPGVPLVVPEVNPEALTQVRSSCEVGVLHVSVNSVMSCARSVWPSTVVPPDADHRINEATPTRARTEFT